MLRQDNADFLLSRIGHQIGLLPGRNFQSFTVRRDQVEAEIARLHSTRQGTETLAHLLKRPDVSYDDLPGARTDVPRGTIEQVEIQIKYEGYINRQAIEIEKFRAMEDQRIPAWMDYDKLPNIRPEAKQKLKTIAPATLGQASRISGVSPSDVSVIMVWMKRGHQN